MSCRRGDAVPGPNAVTLRPEGAHPEGPCRGGGGVSPGVAGAAGRCGGAPVRRARREPSRRCTTRRSRRRRRGSSCCSVAGLWEVSPDTSSGRRHADGATILAAHCDRRRRHLRRRSRRCCAAFSASTRVPPATRCGARSRKRSPRRRGRAERCIAADRRLLGGTATSPERRLRRAPLPAGLAAARPVVLVIDDARPSLAPRSGRALVQWGSGVRSSLLVGARPELRDLRPRS